MEAAIFEDCQNLIENFVKDDSPVFEKFCEQWKKLMFQHMYSAQTTVVEVMQTTSSIFHIAKRTISGKDSIGNFLSGIEGNERRCLLRRIGGVYLLYAVYFKQPTRQYVKMTVSMDTWNEFKDFYNSLPPISDYDDVRYVFWRLCRADAFRFCALDYMAGLEGLVDYDKIRDESQESDMLQITKTKMKQKLTAIPDIQRTLMKTTKLEDEYNNVKQFIMGSNESSEKSLAPTNVFHNIQSAFNSIQEILEGGSPQKLNRRAGLDICTIRRQIKHKALRMSEYEEDDSTDGSEKCESTRKGTEAMVEKTSRKKGHMKRPVLLFNENLPDYISKDLKEESTSSEEKEENNNSDNEGNADETTSNRTENL